MIKYGKRCIEDMNESKFWYLRSKESIGLFKLYSYKLR